jgi:hypothetical protein
LEAELRAARTQLDNAEKARLATESKLDLERLEARHRESLAKMQESIESMKRVPAPDAAATWAPLVANAIQTIGGTMMAAAQARATESREAAMAATAASERVAAANRESMDRVLAIVAQQKSSSADMAPMVAAMGTMALNSLSAVNDLMRTTIEAQRDGQTPAWMKIAEDLIGTVTQVVAGATQTVTGAAPAAGATAQTALASRATDTTAAAIPKDDQYQNHVERVAHAVRAGNENVAATNIIQWYVATRKAGVVDARLTGFDKNPSTTAKKIIQDIGGEDLDEAFATAVGARVVAEIARFEREATERINRPKATKASPLVVDDATSTDGKDDGNVDEPT